MIQFTKKVVDYTVVESYSATSLASDVKAKMSQGWQPFGPPMVEVASMGESMSYSGALIQNVNIPPDSTRFYQAMVLYAAPPPKPVVFSVDVAAVQSVEITPAGMGFVLPPGTKEHGN